jgi:hypothetical protein
MLYDDQTQCSRHLSLPLESVAEAARRMTQEPSPETATTISGTVARRAARSDRVSLSRVRSDLRRAGVDATVEQVAWVMNGQITRNLT